MQNPQRKKPSSPTIVKGKAEKTQAAKISLNNNLREELTGRLKYEHEEKSKRVVKFRPEVSSRSVSAPDPTYKRSQIKSRPNQINQINQINQTNSGKPDYSAFRLKTPFTGKLSFREVFRQIRQSLQPEEELPLIGISVDAIFGLRDFGAAQFLIYDTEPHGGPCNVSIVTGLPPGCPTTYASEFFEYLTINPVVLTEGCFLVDKFNNIIAEFGLPDDIFTFTQKMALYAYTRLFLSYLLYGTFDIKWLAQQYNDQFLADLSRSRYAKFLIIFTDPSIGVEDFWKYFVPTYP